MTKKNGSILIIDDDPGVIQTAKFLLKQEYSVVDYEKDPRKIPFRLTNHSYDIILLDMNFTTGSTSGKEGLTLLREIKENGASNTVVMMTAYGEINLAVEAMKLGAVDFVVKPWENEKFLATISAAFDLNTSKKEIKVLKEFKSQVSREITSQIPDLEGSSHGITEISRLISKVAPSDANVLILGENGTGKEVAAHAIHRQSHRSDAPFIKVDLGALSGTLFEAELFGHLKGSFTDAREDRAGRFEVANGGTIFLDEIGNIDLQMQTKLLSVMQNREVFRIGSSQPIPIDIRMICATNRDLATMVSGGEFREDLYYRLRTFEITMPPLRERQADIHLLAQNFLNKFAARYNKTLEFSAACLKKMLRYDWPGNIRELQHAVERSVILADGNKIDPSLIITEGHVSEAGPVSGGTMESIEKEAIRKAIGEKHGNLSQVAKSLGMGRTTLYRKIKKYGL